MKVGILAGGLGTRFSEETVIKPKPMIEIGEYPIIWHIMKHYYAYNISDFVIALGYRGDVIKKYMADFSVYDGNLTVKMQTGKLERSKSNLPAWTVEMIETGLHTNTGGRIKRLQPYLGSESFMLTWGDGVSDIDLNALYEFHKSHGKLATMTAVRPPARFGHLGLDGDKIVEFSEKPQTSEGWINGAFFVLEPAIFDYIDNDDTLWENEPLERLAKDGQLMAYKHNSFWQCMDTLRDKTRLERLWALDKPPWKIWDN